MNALQRSALKDQNQAGLQLKRTLRTPRLLIAVLATSVIASSVHAQNNADEVGSALDFSHLQKQAIELQKSVVTYGENQRQELLNETEAVLANFDQRIQHLESAIADRENDMSDAARRYAHSLMETLDRQRADFADWVNTLRSGIKNDGQETWDEMMYGFSKAYEQFYDSWEDLELQFGSASL